MCERLERVGMTRMAAETQRRFFELQQDAVAVRACEDGRLAQLFDACLARIRAIGDFGFNVGRSRNCSRSNLAQMRKSSCAPQD